MRVNKRTSTGEFSLVAEYREREGEGREKEEGVGVSPGDFS